MEKLPKLNRNKVLSIVLLLGIAFSVITIVNAVTPNPGHDFTAVSGGVAVGDLLYGSATDVLSALADIATGNALISGGVGVAPLWGKIGLTTHVAGVLPVANGGVPTMTTVTTKNASGLGTGANAAVALASLTAYKVALFTIPYSITVNQLAYNVGVVTTAGTYRICVYNEAGSSKLIDVTDVPVAGVNTVAVGAVTLTPGNYYIAMGCATTCNNTIFMFTSTANTAINTSAVPAGKKEYEGLYTMTSGTCNATIDPTAFTGTISHTVVVRLDN